MDLARIPSMQGQLLGTAYAVLAANRIDGLGAQTVYEEHVRELKRLIGNSIQLRNEIGDPVQLAALIIMLVDGFVPDHL